MKKVCAILMATVFMCAALPVMASAGQQPNRQKLLKKSIAGLQQKLYFEDATALSAITLQFLDDISEAAAGNNTADLQLAAMRYVSDLHEVQAMDNATKCSIPYLISTGTAAMSLIKAAASGNSAFCISNDMTNKVADIMSAKTKYDICILEAAVTPDTAEIDVLTKKLMGIETYDFATNAIQVFACTPAPDAGDYISLLFNFIGIFPKAEK